LALLIPREHSAYGQLLMPLVVALVIGGAAAGALALAPAAVAAFLAHEPLLVLLGQRGGRASRDRNTDARRSFVLFGIVAIVSGCLAVALLPTRGRLALVVPVAFALVAAVLVTSGRERTTGGEGLIALALTSASFPIVMAGGASVQAAATVGAVFAATFVSATPAVRAAICPCHEVSPWSPPNGRSDRHRAPCARARSPQLLASMPAPRHLRRIDWTIVGVRPRRAWCRWPRSVDAFFGNGVLCLVRRSAAAAPERPVRGPPIPQ